MSTMVAVREITKAKVRCEIHRPGSTSRIAMVMLSEEKKKIIADSSPSLHAHSFLNSAMPISDTIER